MARRSKKQPDSPAGLPATLEELKATLPTAAELPDPSLPTFAEKLTAQRLEQFKDELTEKSTTGASWTKPGLAEDLKPAARITTARPFIGPSAGGRGRKVIAEDENWVVKADRNPLTAGEVALGQRNGLDVVSSPDAEVTQMAGSKAEVRRVNGDLNYVGMVLTGPDAGRGR